MAMKGGIINGRFTCVNVAIKGYRRRITLFRDLFTTLIGSDFWV